MREIIKNENLLFLAMEMEGYGTVFEMLEEAVYDSIVPGICRNCETTTQCEPDAINNWCPGCEENEVESVLSLAGII